MIHDPKNWKYLNSYLHLLLGYDILKLEKGPCGVRISILRSHFFLVLIDWTVDTSDSSNSLPEPGLVIDLLKSLWWLRSASLLDRHGDTLHQLHRVLHPVHHSHAHSSVHAAIKDFYKKQSETALNHRVLEVPGEVYGLWSPKYIFLC